MNQTAIDTSDDLQDIVDPHDELTEYHEIKKKSVAGVVSYFMRTLFLQGLGLVSTLILSAFLTAEDFGIYGVVIQIIGILVFFSDVGLAASLIQKKTKPTEKDYQTAFTVQFLLSLFIVAVVLLIIWTGFIQQKTGNVGVWILLSLALSFPLATMKTIPSIKLERKLNFSRLVIPQILEQITFHSILIVLAWNQFGAVSYAYAIIARSVVGAVSMQILEPWLVRLKLDQASFKELLSFGVKFQLNDFLARIKDQLFFLVLGFFLPLREFGYISWAKNWSLYPYNLTVQNVMAITFPTFSRLQDNLTALKSAIEKSLFFITLAIFPILVGMSVFILPLVRVVERYNKWEPAVLSLVLFSLSIGWGAVSTPLTNTLNAIGKINTTLKLMLIWTSLTWALSPALVVLMGYNGVAMASFIISFSSYLSIYYVKKVIPIEVWDEVWRQLFAAGMMAGVGVVFFNVWATSLLHLFAGFAITAIVYLGSFMLVGHKKLFGHIASLRRYSHS